MSETIRPIRILDLPGALEQLRSQSLPLEVEDVGFADQERSDVSMLKEVSQNRLLSEAFVASRGLLGTWSLSELMLRAYVEPQKWKGSDQYRSHLGIPLLAENFYSSLSSFQQVLFAGSRPFIIDPTAATTMDVARAQEVLLTAQLKTCGPKKTSAKQQIRYIAYDGLLYGTGVGLVGWETRKIKTIKRRRKAVSQTIALNAQGATATAHSNEDDIETFVQEIDIDHPILEHVPLRRVRVAPDCRQGNIRTASWAGRIIYLNSYELDSLRDMEGPWGGAFNIPAREQLIGLTTPFKNDTSTNSLDNQGGGATGNPLSPSSVGTTPQQAYPEYMNQASNVDPLAQKFEVFEYWTADRVVWVLENQYVLRNESHDMGVIPMVSFNFREAPDSFFGYGMGMWLTDFQKIAQGVTNAYFDDLNLRLMGTYTSEKGLNNMSQSTFIFPGRVIKADGPNGLVPMNRNSAVGDDPLTIVDQVKGWGASIAGAGAGIQGSNPGKSGDMRTPAGVQMIANGENAKMQDLIDQMCELVFVPLLEFMIEQNRRLKPSQVRQMLNDNLAEAFKGDPLDVINGSYKVSISAGAKLQARTALMQSLGYIQTLLQQPQLSDQLSIQAQKIDYAVAFKAILETNGYPYLEQLVVPMNDEDKQRMAAQQNQGKLQNDLAKIDAQTQGKIKVNENQSENRALLRTQEAMFEKDDKSVLGS